MRIMIESTDVLTTVNGVLVRLWAGETDDGIPVKVFIALIAVDREEDTTAFDRDLKEVGEPLELLPLGAALLKRRN